MNALNRRIFRGLKNNFVKYLVSFIIFIIGTMMFVAISDSTDSINLAVNNLITDSNCEDGNFLVYSPLSNEQIESLNLHGVTLEKNFYINIKDSSNGTTYRIYKNRNLINLLQLRDGEYPNNSTDIVVEQHYAKTKNLNISDSLNIDNNNFSISGHGYVIDYDSLYEVGDGPYPDYENFCLCFVNDSCFNKLANNYTVHYNYSYILDKGENNYKDADLNDFLKNTFVNTNTIAKANSAINSDTCNLISLIKRSDNQRIISFSNDISINKSCTMPMGVVFFIMLSFLIATLAVSEVRKESKIVGTLSALGYNNAQLTIHFITLPVCIVASASILGTILGFKFAPFFMQNYINGGCVMNVKPIIFPYLIIYGIILPILISIVVNAIVVNKALNKSVSSLLRGGTENYKSKTYLNLDKFKFRIKYQIRQLTRELPMHIALLISLILTIFMVVFGTALYSTLSSFKTDCENTMHYEYKYLYRFPTSKAPEGGEEAYERSFQTQFDENENNFTIRMIGLKENSDFFDCNTLECGEDEMIVSASMRDKFGWKKGDIVPLKDNLDGTIHNYKVIDVMDLQYGMYVFTDINTMRSEYCVGNNYWNVIYSHNKLDIDESNLAETLTKTSSLQGASSRIDSLMGVILSLLCMGILIFVGMLYMIINLMTQKYETSICTLKILGYSHSKVCQMYLLNSLFIVIISMLISIPISFKVVTIIYPNIIATVLNGMLVKMPIGILLAMIALILASWLFVALIISNKLSKISLLDILRSRE
ncbi:FtsX-like permease family protein [Clostridium sp. DSM 8431]|uniref:ABC transporter permease n=1 Tax=Clostridium sp. DSM 8431 TaxID=1761781 RepID=UPI0008EA5478|nr:ABC transporter permease [Clostridium sp. DSM 8431]SFU71449.1 FtsX-like permease family protein [Clostridium sp. DSM 8431]